MAIESNVKAVWKATGKAGFGILKATAGSKVLHADKLDITRADAREKFVSTVCERSKGIDREELADQLIELAGSIVDDGDTGRMEKTTQAQALVKLADTAELFHDDNAAFATVRVGEPPAGHRETHPIKSAGFRDWLHHQYWTAYGKPAGGQALQDAVEALSAKARYQGAKIDVFVRVGRHGNDVYFDLRNAKCEAVRITAGGWQIVPDPPVKFIHKRGALPLPLPIAGGQLSELRELLNAGDESNWRLIVAWLVGCLWAEGPFPILAVNGEQGSAKSTTCRMLRRLIDPNTADLRALPRDTHGLMIAAGNSWIVGLDNLSHIPPDFSDALCRIATGGGYSARELYSNDSECLFQVARPIIFNGIEELATRPDLLERSILLHLPSIPDSSRRAEADLWKQFESAGPRILGALFDAVAESLRNIDTVKLDALPRMADFARRIVAAEPALPWPPGGFMEAYAVNRADAFELALESSAVAMALQTFMVEGIEWEGTTKELLTALESEPYTDVKTRGRLDWPKTPKSLSNQLGRISPTLRRIGIELTRPGRTGRDRRRIIHLEYTPKQSSAPSAPSPIPAQLPGFNTLADGADGADDQISVHSGNSAIGGGR